jgi:hypothetical protein
VTGSQNTAVGYAALENAQGGFNNIAIGSLAGDNLGGSENNNIDIGNAGVFGDPGFTRIGVQGQQQAAYIAGIGGVPLVGAGSAVYVDPNTGQLGIQGSSQRFKTDIASMHLDLAKVLELRPVTFHYNSQPSGTLQYGLIAEEVAKVFPDLVVRDNKGTIITVRYDELSSLLLKEVQIQQAAMTDQQKQLNQLTERFGALEKQNRELQAAVVRVTKDMPAQRP